MVVYSKERIARLSDRPAFEGLSKAGDLRLNRLEQASREAGAQLSLAIEALGEGFVLYDQDDRLVICNQRYRDIYAISAAAMVPGARFEDILRFGLAHGQYATARGREEAWLAERLAAHREPYSSHEQELGDGRWLQVIEQATPEGGRIGLRLDITERKRQEAAAIASKRQLQATLAAIPDLLFELDADGRFVDCHVNDSSRLLVPREALIGKTIAETMPPEVAAICETALAEAVATGSSTGHQYRLKTPRGDDWFELSVARKPDTARPGNDPAPPRFIALARDITERKELEQSLAAERDFLEQIMATSLSAIVVIDASGQLVFANKAAERVLGVKASTATDRQFDDPAWRVTDVDGGPKPIEEIPFALVMRTGKPVFDVRHAIEWPDGTRRILSVNAAPLAASPGATNRVVCSVTDITDKVQAESELRHQEALLRGLFELCPVGIALNDLETGRFIDANAAVLGQTGYSRDELLAMDFWELTPPEYHEESRLNLERMVETGRYGPFEKENIRRDGSRFPAVLTGMIVTDLEGRRLTWSIVEDITDRKANEARVLRQARYDELTGLPNRRLFQERLEQALERARRGRHQGAVAMLDLDHFKKVNDSLGHKAGDTVLVEAAARLLACTRATDTVARFGGDEFLLLVDDIKAPADAETIAKKIQRALARPFTVEGRRMQLGVSIGICVFDALRNDPGEILRFADKAMYAAKNAGRNQTRFFAILNPEPRVDRRRGRD